MIPTISRRPCSNTVPLSIAQERFWLLHQLDPANPVHNRPLALRLTGELDKGTLSNAIDALLMRHEVLRCTLKTVGAEPVQVILPTLHLQLTEVDLRSWPEIAVDEEAQRLADESMSEPFDLSNGPLLRVLLLHLRTSEYLLLFTMNHMLCDGWSARIFTEELGATYEALSSGTPPHLPTLNVQYADYSWWQRRQIEDGLWAQEVAYWTEKLAAAPLSLELPIARPRASRRTYRGHTQTAHLPASLTKTLATLAGQESATLFMLLFSAFNILLCRYSGQTDLVIGTPVAGRPHLELQSMMGFLSNTLALRSDLSGNPTFRQLLNRTRQAAVEAYAHQNLPFDTLLERLQLERDPALSPLFQVMFNFENFRAMSSTGKQLHFEEIHLHSRTVPYDLILEIHRHPDGLSVKCAYNSDLFDNEAIVRFLGHYRTLLEGIAVHPDAGIHSLPLLTEAERGQLLLQWNDTASVFPRTSTIHDLFVLQAERTPDAIAVESVDGQLSYRQLDRLSDNLAHHLCSMHVTRGCLVAVFMTRRLELAVALLGILKAGGAYLPLDPGYPDERLEYIIKDAEPHVILTDQKLFHQLPHHSIPVICVDDGFHDHTRVGDDKPAPSATADDLVYAIYTSGSTGKPKGVLITHRSLVNNVMAVARHIGLGPDDRRLQMATLAFDVAPAEFFSCWSVGATVVLWPDVETSSLNRFIDFVAARRLTVTGLPMFLWHELVTELEQHPCSLPDELRLIIVGDDEALSDYLTRWRGITDGSVRWINAYGPTESTITATLYEPADDSFSTCRTVPIGRPIANTRTYILDAHMNPVPVGVPGELYIGGEGLARGYLNNAELTAAKFITDPPTIPNERRLYRTGDLVRYLPDGNMVFLGRIDRQVKVRGFRVEPGEIESAANRHPAVRQCVVTAASEGHNRRLIAYFTVADGASLPEASLRRHLRHSLPGYMIPELLVPLEQMPIGPTGKIDRNSLPLPNECPPEQKFAHTNPRTKLEGQLVTIWSDVLGTDRFGIHDDFFDLGGQSLDAMKIAARLDREHDIQIPIKLFFENCTVATLAACLEDESGSTSN